MSPEFQRQAEPGDRGLPTLSLSIFLFHRYARLIPADPGDRLYPAPPHTCHIEGGRRSLLGYGTLQNISFF